MSARIGVLSLPARRPIGWTRIVVAATVVASAATIGYVAGRAGTPASHTQTVTREVPVPVVVHGPTVADLRGDYGTRHLPVFAPTVSDLQGDFATRHLGDYVVPAGAAPLSFADDWATRHLGEFAPAAPATAGSASGGESCGIVAIGTPC